MSQFWFKVYSPEHDETRILWMDVPRGDDIYIFKQLKDDVCVIFTTQSIKKKVLIVLFFFSCNFRYEMSLVWEKTMSFIFYIQIKIMMM